MSSKKANCQWVSLWLHSAKSWQKLRQFKDVQPKQRIWSHLQSWWNMFIVRPWQQGFDCQYPSPDPSWSLSWPALPCPGPSWQGYYPKFGVVPPPTPQGTLRVVVAVDGFWVGVFVFSLLLINSYQPNFEIPMGHMKTLYSCSFIIIRLYRCI